MTSPTNPGDPDIVGLVSPQMQQLLKEARDRVVQEVAKPEPDELEILIERAAPYLDRGHVFSRETPILPSRLVLLRYAVMMAHDNKAEARALMRRNLEKARAVFRAERAALDNPS